MWDPVSHLETARLEPLMKLISTRHILCSAIALTFAFAMAQSAEARPQYNKAFKAKYEEKFEGKDVKFNCNVCHDAKSKKKISQYGMDMKEKLGDKNVKDADAIEAAFKAVEAMDSQTEGKTYGDLLNSGEFPAPYSE